MRQHMFARIPSSICQVSNCLSRSQFPSRAPHEFCCSTCICRNASRLKYRFSMQRSSGPRYSLHLWHSSRSSKAGSSGNAHPCCASSALLFWYVKTHWWNGSCASQTTPRSSHNVCSFWCAFWGHSLNCRLTGWGRLVFAFFFSFHGVGDMPSLSFRTIFSLCGAFVHRKEGHRRGGNIDKCGSSMVSPIIHKTWKAYTGELPGPSDVTHAAASTAARRRQTKMQTPKEKWLHVKAGNKEVFTTKLLRKQQDESSIREWNFCMNNFSMSVWRWRWVSSLLVILCLYYILNKSTGTHEASFYSPESTQKSCACYVRCFGVIDMTASI